MVTFIKISKQGNFSEEKLDNIDNLYKKCGLRKPDGFCNIFEYNSSKGNLELWSRNNGKANMKSSYIFPFKDSLQLYGTSALLLKTDNYIDLTVNMLDELVNTKEENNSKVVINDSDNDSSEESSDEDSVSGDTSEVDSELKLEDYIYSSEEEQ
jgi:hypothetical protein